MFYLFSSLQRYTQNKLIEINNYLFLFDVSCLLSDFAIPFVKNMDDSRRMRKEPDKVSKLNGIPIKLLVTPTIGGICAKKLHQRKIVQSYGVADMLIEKMLEFPLFHVKPIRDTSVDSKMISDFEEHDHKYEDTIHISTANSYKIPIVTSEQRKIDVWKDHCECPVIYHVDFWKFVDECRKKCLSKKKVERFARKTLFSD